MSCSAHKTNELKHQSFLDVPDNFDQYYLSNKHKRGIALAFTNLFLHKMVFDAIKTVRTKPLFITIKCTLFDSQAIFLPLISPSKFFCLFSSHLVYCNYLSFFDSQKILQSSPSVQLHCLSVLFLSKDWSFSSILSGKMELFVYFSIFCKYFQISSFFWFYISKILASTFYILLLVTKMPYQYN